MKFTYQLSYNAYAPWHDHYINYKKLKKLIKRCGKASSKTSSEHAKGSHGHKQIGDPRASDQSGQGWAVFQAALASEMTKVSAFFTKALNDLLLRTSFFVSRDEDQTLSSRPLDIRSKSSTSMRSSVSSEGSNDDSRRGSQVGFEQSHANGTTKKNTTGLIPADRKKDLKTALQLLIELNELKKFVQLNVDGFRKIVKKYDKFHGSDYAKAFAEAKGVPVEAAKGRLTGDYSASASNHDLDSATDLKDECDAMKQSCDSELVPVHDKLVKFVADEFCGGSVEACEDLLATSLTEIVEWQKGTVWSDLLRIERRRSVAPVGISTKRDNSQKGSNKGTGLGSGSKAEGSAQGVSSTGGVVNSAKSFISACIPFDLPPFLLQSVLAVLLAMLPSFLSGFGYGMPIQAAKVLGMILSIAWMWSSGMLPLFVTALFVPVIYSLLRQVGEQGIGAKNSPAPSLLSCFFTNSTAMILASFSIASAVSKLRLDKRLAAAVLVAFGASPARLLAGLMLASWIGCFLVGNMAASILVLSVCLSILDQLPPKSRSSRVVARHLVLGVVFAANLGGMTTPVSSPQNMVVFASLSQYGVSFLQFTGVMSMTSLVVLVSTHIILTLSMHMQLNRIPTVPTPKGVSVGRGSGMLGLERASMIMPNPPQFSSAGLMKSDLATPLLKLPAGGTSQAVSFPTSGIPPVMMPTSITRPVIALADNSDGSESASSSEAPFNRGGSSTVLTLPCKVTSPLRQIFCASTEETATLFITALACALWMWPANPVTKSIGGEGMASMLVMALFYSVPGLLTKSDLLSMPWDICLLLGAGGVVSVACTESGLLSWVGSTGLGQLAGLNPTLIIFAASAIAAVISTFVSHTCAANILMPFLLEMSANMHSSSDQLGLVLSSGACFSAGMALIISSNPNMNAISICKAHDDEPWVQPQDYLMLGTLVTSAAALASSCLIPTLCGVIF